MTASRERRAEHAGFATWLDAPAKKSESIRPSHLTVVSIARSPRRWWPLRGRSSYGGLFIQLWPFVRQAIPMFETLPRPRNWPSWDVLVVALYSCAVLVLWWAPLPHVARWMLQEAGRAPDELERVAGDALHNHRAIALRLKLSLSSGQSEVEMRHLIVGFVLLGVAFAPAVSAQPKSWSSSDARTLLAAGELRVISAMPLYFRVLAGTVSSAEESRHAEGNGVLYQFSGATELSIAGSVRCLRPGEGTYIPGGARFTLKAFGEKPSTYLYFVVSPGVLSADTRQPSTSAREIYRSSVPIANSTGELCA